MRLLTHLRYIGLCFNPASFYDCLDRGGETLLAVVVEVHSTPWGERHAYVIPSGERGRTDAARADLAAREVEARVELAGIYWLALRLWLEGAPFHPHPARRAGPKEARA